MTLEENVEKDKTIRDEWKNIPTVNVTVLVTKVSDGVRLYLAYYGSTLAGFMNVWENHGGYIPNAAIMHAYTMPYLRRKGVLTQLFEKLKQDYKVILTANANEMSEPFLKKNGFGYSEQLGGWIYTANEGEAK